ncbi:hypothetical protein LAZ67_3005842 [Cordylochernes scorpioides]|uniref:LysM domain-containing protein n=1 Tax=Cordylochernes scorpioides TaxID=51811 RepID=A0ABY6KAT2_9ARAC|nr:hypothetical protein LAZ67_3005842 [Cordylochernes scorpioides]
MLEHPPYSPYLAPYDFSLFPHVKNRLKDNDEVCSIPNTSGGADKENRSPEKKPLTRSLTQPKNTVEYVVQASDTLSGVAARFETTPSELANLNRLASRMIFPGQIGHASEINRMSQRQVRYADSTMLHSSKFPEKVSPAASVMFDSLEFPNAQILKDKHAEGIHLQTITSEIQYGFRRFPIYV